jgi:acetyltransferase
MKRNFSAFFEPNSVAVIGASYTPGKPGHEVIRNILANDYKGQVYLVNPKGGELLGLPVQTSIANLPEGIDLAIIILPAKESPPALRECILKGIRHFVLAAGGFAEVDEYGAQIQEELIDIIQKNKIMSWDPISATQPHQSHPPSSSARSDGVMFHIAKRETLPSHDEIYSTAEHFGSHG